MFDLKNILKAAKNSYQEVTKENKQLKQYITNIEQQKYQQQQQRKYSRLKEYTKVVYEEETDSEIEQDQQETPNF